MGLVYHRYPTRIWGAIKAPKANVNRGCSNRADVRSRESWLQWWSHDEGQQKVESSQLAQWDHLEQSIQIEDLTYFEMLKLMHSLSVTSGRFGWSGTGRAISDSQPLRRWIGSTRVFTALVCFVRGTRWGNNEKCPTSLLCHLVRRFFRCLILLTGFKLYPGFLVYTVYMFEGPFIPSSFPMV